MTDMVPFVYGGQQVRIVGVDGEPWFVAADVCAVLGLANVGNALARLDDDQKSSIHLLTDGTPGNPNRAVVSESGLYDLIIRSDKPEARPFRRWITSEVLPSIRRTGSYGAAPALPQTYAEALRAYADEVEARELADRKVAELEPAAEQMVIDAAGSADDESLLASLLACGPAPEYLYCIQFGARVKVGVTADIRRRQSQHAASAAAAGVVFEPLMFREPHLEARENERALVARFGRPGSRAEYLDADVTEVLRFIASLPATYVDRAVWQRAFDAREAHRVASGTDLASLFGLRQANED